MFVINKFQCILILHLCLLFLKFIKTFLTLGHKYIYVNYLSVKTTIDMQLEINRNIEFSGKFMILLSINLHDSTNQFKPK